jgi:hypothetical protein
MTKQELKLLERAFAADVDSSNRSATGGIIQTKGKIASKLADDGLLEKAEFTINCVPPVTVKGYVITMLGHFTYCANCGSDE